MIYDDPKYLHFASVLATSSYSEVASFAQTVVSGALEYYMYNITLEQFNDGIFIDVPAGLSEEETLQRNSINYIKECIAMGLAEPPTASVEPL